MKRFKTFIITKKTLRRAGLIFGIALTSGAAAFALLRSEPPAVPTFGSAAPEAILDAGMAAEDEPFGLREFISNILGFDADKPESIIKSSSAVFGEAEQVEAEPTAAPSDAPPSPEPKKTDYRAELPPHEEIIAARGLKLNNATNYAVDTAALCAEKTDIDICGAEPEVLIMHTHTTECFSGDEMAGKSERTTDEMKNMCAVGAVIADTLEELGIHCVHDKTIHDYPTYQGSYTRALKTITRNIEEYPTIKVVLDIHRDAYIYSDGSKLRVAAKIDGEDAAQVMLVLGTDSMGLYHPYWKKNLALACKIQNAAEIMYPGLMRPIDLRRERFNMHVTTGSLLIEVGSNGNTLAEAERSAKLLARCIAAALING